MDSNLQDVIVDLKIISMLEPSRKLYLYEDSLALEPISIFSPIKRFLNNSGRKVVIRRIKQRVMEMENIFSSDFPIYKEWIKNEIYKLIDPVKIGLSTLKDTYPDDYQLHANLDLLIARIEYLRYSNDKLV
jgi:hypothetical protein